jgi:hypothetical protein
MFEFFPKPAAPKEDTMTVHFHMRNGSVVEAHGVTNVEMTRENSTGQYSAYSIEWAKGRSMRLFTLSIPDIVAVVAVNET